VDVTAVAVLNLDVAPLPTPPPKLSRP